MFICTCRLRFWVSCLTVLLKVQVFSGQSPKLFKKKQIFKVNFHNFVVSAGWSVVFHTWPKNFQQRQINHSNSKNDNRKIKLFRKTNHFSSRHFSGIANSCCKKPEENFLTRSPFFHLEVRRSLQSCSISKKKLFFLKIFWSYVGCSFDNHVGIFSLKLQVSLLKNWKCFQKAYALEKILPIFFICRLNLWFWNPWLTFLSDQKKTHTVPKKPQNAKFTFINFFLKCWTGHLKCAFDNPEKTFSPENRCFRSMTEHFHTIIFASGIFFLRMFICICRLRFWVSCLTVLLKVQVFSGQSPKLFKKKQIFKVNFHNFVVSAGWSVVFHTWPKNFQQRQINHSNSKNDNRKIKLFRKTNHFSSRHFSGIANSCCKKPEENFLTRSPFFSSRSPKKFAIMFNFKKKLFFLKIFWSYVGCSFDNHVGIFSLKLQVSLLKNWKCFQKAYALEKILPIFFICRLNLWFWNPWLTFLSDQKKTHTVPKKPQNAKFTFINFFLKCWTGHLKCAFDNPEKTFSPENRCFRSMTEHFHTIIFASGIFFLRMFICICRLRFWVSCLTVLLKVQVFSGQSPKLLKKTNF